MAWRRQRRRWRITLLAVVILGLAMGASTAMFSVYYGLVANPLPFPQSRRMVWVQSVNRQSGLVEGGMSTPDLLDYRVATHTLEHVAGYAVSTTTLLGRGNPQHLAYADVTGDFFPALEVAPLLGREFTRQDEVNGGPKSVILSYGLWRSRFGDDRGVVGQTADFDHTALTVVGVMPPGFAYPQGARLWVPNDGTFDINAHRAWRYLSVLARLSPGATVGEAQQEMSAIAGRLARTYPRADADAGVRITSLVAHAAGPAAPTLTLMLAGTLLVLALACANVGNLMLGAAMARWPELALQVSLGASRQRLFGQLLAEGAILAILAGALGWVLALGAMPLVRHLQVGALSLQPIHLQGAVLAFAAVLTVLMAIWFALAPAWEILRPASARNLRRSLGPQPKRSRLSAGLVIAEVAITVILSIGAGLFWQNLRRLQQASPGFNATNVLTFRTTLLYNNTTELNQKTPFFARLNQSLRALPGVMAAGMVSDLPLAEPEDSANVAVAGTPGASGPPGRLPLAAEHSIEPGYFQTLEVPIRGRALTYDDGQSQGAIPVIITQALAGTVLGGREALGATLVLFRGGGKRVVRVVGVVGYLARNRPGGPAQEAVFFPDPKMQFGSLYTLLRTRNDPDNLLPAVRRTVQQLDPNIAVFDVAPLQQHIAAVAAPVAERTNLLLAMAMLALVLAAAGLYGVLAHSVAQQQRDIGIRMALGASVAQVGGVVLRRSAQLVVSGIALGLLASWWLRGSVQALLASSGAGQAWTWTVVPLGVLVIGLLAGSLPAHRAAHLDPAQTLRHE
ncbi:MAG: ADOP family duplicated permease [Terriglobales bacterium]